MHGFWRKKMPNKNEKGVEKWHLIRGFVALSVLMAVLIIPTFSSNLESVENKQKSQRLVCDGSGHIVKFSNYTTLYAWLEQIRWEGTNEEFNIKTTFTTGKPLLLSYRCKLPI